MLDSFVIQLLRQMISYSRFQGITFKRFFPNDFIEPSSYLRVWHRNETTMSRGNNFSWIRKKIQAGIITWVTLPKATPLVSRHITQSFAAASLVTRRLRSASVAIKAATEFRETTKLFCLLCTAFQKLHASLVMISTTPLITPHNTGCEAIMRQYWLKRSKMIFHVVLLVQQAACSCKSQGLFLKQNIKSSRIDLPKIVSSNIVAAKINTGSLNLGDFLHLFCFKDVSNFRAETLSEARILTSASLWQGG